MCCVKLKSAALHIFQGGQITKHAQPAVLKAKSDSKLFILGQTLTVVLRCNKYSLTYNGTLVHKLRTMTKL